MSSSRSKNIAVVKPQSRKAASSHKGHTIQKWSIVDMRDTLVFYFSTRAPGYKGKQFGYKAIADKYQVPRETFRRRLSGPLKGYYGHIAGGKQNPKNFVSTAHANLLLTPIRLALPNTLPTPVIMPTTPAPLPAVAAGQAPAAAGRAPVPDEDEESGKLFFTFYFYFCQVSCRHSVC